MKLKKNEKKLNIKLIIVTLLAIVFLIYIIYTIIHLIIRPTQSFMVENGDISFEESAQGYIIRDETVIKGENYKNGIAQIKTEGEKVAKGEAIFRYYTSGEEKLKSKISELDVKIREAMEKESDIYAVDIKALDTQIHTKLKESSELSDLQKIKEYKNEINNAIMKKAKIAGEKSPSGSYLKQLIEERSNYENELNSGSEYVTSTRSGVVSYRVDGLEDVITPANLASLSKSMLQDLNLKTGEIVATSEESGKVIDNFYCYIACVLKNENIEAANVKVGSKVRIRLSNSKEVKAEVQYISAEGEKESLVVLKITNYVEELINYRKISFEVIWWNAEGLKAPNDAIMYEEREISNTNSDENTQTNTVASGDNTQTNTILENLETTEEGKVKIAYVIRKRVGYTDKIYVKVLKKGEKYSIIKNYTSKELKALGFSSEEINSRKIISMYDELSI